MRWRNIHKTAALVLLLGAFGNALAQPLPERIALADYLRLVQQHNPGLHAERMQIDAARADLDTARALPNPVLSHSTQPGEHETAIEQPLPIFGQRRLRIGAARLGIDAAAARVESQRASTLHQAAQQFIALLIAQEKCTRWQQAQTQMDAAWQIVAGQVEAGARSRYDLTRIDIERANAQMQTAQAHAELSAARADVAINVGAVDWQPQALGQLAVSLDARDFDTLWARAQTRLPAIREALAEQALADKMVDVEKRDTWPTPALGIGKLHDGDGRHSVLGLTLEIPLFDRRRGAIARAHAQALEASLRRHAVLRHAEQQLRRATDLLAQRQTLTQAFHDHGLARLPQLQQMAHDAYTLGQGSILELIDSIQSITEHHLAWLDLTESLLQAELDVRFAAGEMGE